MAVRQLPHGVVKLISSTQVISSVSSVVKELLENAIDAGASVIDIKLVSWSLYFCSFILRAGNADTLCRCSPNYVLLIWYDVSIISMRLIFMYKCHYNIVGVSKWRHVYIVKTDHTSLLQEKYGLDKIEVRDNGYGINTSDVYHVCLPSYTSKIYSLEDLGKYVICKCKLSYPRLSFSC